MAEKPVIVPVELQVTDLDMSKVSLADVQKEVSQKLSGLKKVVSDIFAGIDPSKMSKAVTSSMTAVEKSLARALQAQDRLNTAMAKAGMSSDLYKAKIAGIDDQIKVLKTQMEDIAGLGPAADPIRNQVAQELQRLSQERASINPLDFIDSATPEAVARVAEAYRKVGIAVEGVNQQAQAFNQAVDNGNVSKEYQEQADKANKLKEKLEELNEKSKRMAALGATDKQWESLQYDVKQVSSELDSTLRTMRAMVKEGSAFNFDAAEEEVKRLKAEISSIDATRRNIAGSGKSTGTIGARARANMDPYTEDYQAKLQEMSKLEVAVSRLVEKYKELQVAGKLTPESMMGIDAEAQKLQGQIELLSQELRDMVNSGQAFRFGDANVANELSLITSRVNDTQSALSSVTTQSNAFSNALREMIDYMRGVSPEFDRFCQGAQKTWGVLSKVVSVGGEVASKIGKGFAIAASAIATVASKLRVVVGALGIVAKGAAKVIGKFTIFGKLGSGATADIGTKFKQLRKNILMFGLGFRTMYYAIKRLRTIIVTAFKTLVQQVTLAGDSTDGLNEKLSSMMMSLNRLKGSLATAFQPLATYIIPALDTLMSKLADTMEALGTFFATMTGQKYIYKAISNQVDFAHSIGATGKAADSTAQKLGAYDKLNVVQDNSNALNVTYEKQSIEDSTTSLAAALKKAWEDQDFEEVGKLIGEKLSAMFENLSDNIMPKLGGVVSKIANGLLTLFQGLDMASVGQQLGNALATLLDNVDAAQIGAALQKFKMWFWKLLSGVFGGEGLDPKEFGKKLGDFVAAVINNIDVNAILTIIKNLATALVTALIQAVRGINWKDLYKALFDGITDTLDGVKDAIGDSGSSDLLENLSGLIGALREVLATLLPVIGKIGATLGGVLKETLPLLTDSLPLVADVLAAVAQDILPVISSLVKNINPVVNRLTKAVLPALLKIVKALEPAFLAIADYVLPLLGNILDSIMPLIEGVLTLVTSLLAPILAILGPLLKIVTNVLTPIMQLLTPIFDVLGFICQLIGLLLEPILEILAPLFELVNSILEPITELLTTILMLLTPLLDIIEFIVSLASGVVIEVIKAIIGVLKFLLDIIANVFDAIGLGVKFIKGVFEKAFKSFKDILNKVIAAWESILNFLVKGLNWIIGGINKIGIDIPSWVPGIGGKRFGFNLSKVSDVKLPRLAEGAVIPPNKEFLAMLGDQKSGTNIEAPLDTIKQALAEVIAELGSVGHEPIILQLDGRTVAKVVWAEEEKRYKQTGKSSVY